MELRNHSPFPPLLFQSRDVERHDFGVVVLRGTFDLAANRPLTPAVQQDPLVLADEYLGEPGRSSILVENNLAPYKPRGDLQIIADAVAPGGIPQDHWDAAVRFGSQIHRFSVTGPRKWTRSLRGWTLGAPRPTVRVPVIYENAFGGTIRTKDVPESSYEGNPVGKGWGLNRLPRDLVEADAPSLVPFGRYNFSVDDELPVVGLLPIPPQWKKRRDFAGTFSTYWEKTRWPDLPEDFRFDFYNSSPLQFSDGGFFHGNEELEFLNLHAISPLRIQLPDIQLHGLVRCLNGQILPTPINLDTVSIDLKQNRVYLVWRGIFPVDNPIRVFEVRLRAPDYLFA